MLYIYGTQQKTNISLTYSYKLQVDSYTYSNYSKQYKLLIICIMLDQLAHYGSQFLSKIEFLLTQTVHSSLNYITCAAVQHTDTCFLVLSLLYTEEEQCMVKHEVKNVKWSRPGNETSYFLPVCSLLTLTNMFLITHTCHIKCT